MNTRKKLLAYMAGCSPPCSPPPPTKYSDRKAIKMQLPLVNITPQAMFGDTSSGEEHNVILSTCLFSNYFLLSIISKSMQRVIVRIIFVLVFISLLCVYGVYIWGK